MTRPVRRRFFLETGLAVATALAAIATAISPAWIEAVFGVDPDGGSGALEWAIVVSLALASVTSAALARREARRAAHA
jgi:hypothetical protein